MKSALALLIALSSVQAFAAASPSQTCKAAVLKRATQIKTDAKAITRSVEDQLDAGLDRDGDPTLGMSTRDSSRGAQAILDAVRDLQQSAADGNSQLADSSNEWLIQLCNNKLDTNAAIENY